MNFISGYELFDLIMNDYGQGHKLVWLQKMNQSFQNINYCRIHRLKFAFMNFISFDYKLFWFVMND